MHAAISQRRREAPPTARAQRDLLQQERVVVGCLRRAVARARCVLLLYWPAAVREAVEKDYYSRHFVRGYPLEQT
jgi:hypothetical protein